MKKRFGALVLALVMALTLAIPAGATNVEQTPEELYEEYLVAVEEVNEQYGMDVRLDPLEEMDTDNMPTVEEIRADAVEFSKTLQSIKVEEESDVIILSIPGVGWKSVVVYPKKTWANRTFKWRITAMVGVNTPTGTPNYYFNGIQKVQIVNSSIPAGYTSKPTGTLQTILSSNKKVYTIQQTQTLYYGEDFSATVVAIGTFTVNSSTGSVTGVASAV